MVLTAFIMATTSRMSVMYEELTILFNALIGEVAERLEDLWTKQAFVVQDITRKPALHNHHKHSVFR